jgi:hypothetical protein
MNAVLKRLHSPDVADLHNYRPREPFQVLIQAMIGPDSGPGEESFDFLVCSPSWLAQEVADGGYQFGRHRLVVAQFDLAVIRNAIESICEGAEGDDWRTIAGQIARHGRWEFEDYKPI